MKIKLDLRTLFRTVFLPINRSLNQTRVSPLNKAVFKSEKEAFKKIKNAIVIRPGVIIGGGDIFLKRLLPIFKMSFFVPLFGDGKIKFQPVFIDDVSLAVEKIINNKIIGKNIYELAGPRILAYRDFYTYISKCLNRTKVLVPVPLNLMKILM